MSTEKTATEVMNEIKTTDSTNVPITTTTGSTWTLDTKQLAYDQLWLQKALAKQARPLGPFNTTPPKPYEAKIKNRVAIPIRTPSYSGGSLEMTIGAEGEMIDLTLIIPNRQAIEIQVHRKDLEALFGHLTLDKLGK
jgi:hypothetical protein